MFEDEWRNEVLSIYAGRCLTNFLGCSGKF